MTVRFPRVMFTAGWFTAAWRKRTLAQPVFPEQLKQGFCPGIMTTVPPPEPPEPAGGGPQEGVSGEMGAKPGSLPGGGPQEGVSGEMGAKPGSLPGGGPQEGVSGEIGAKPGSLPGGGPQEGVSGEMGAKPGSLSLVCAIRTTLPVSEPEFVTNNPFLSIYIRFPFCLIAHANGIVYHIALGGYDVIEKIFFSDPQCNICGNVHKSLAIFAI